MSGAYLFVREGPNTGMVYRLGDGPLLAGRGEDCQIRLTDPFVSRAHFRIVYDDEEEGHVLFDLGSRNCTEVNGQPLRRRRLRKGDEIQVGSSRIMFVPADADGLPQDEESSSFARARTARFQAVGGCVEMIGECAGIRRIQQQIKVAGPLDVTVLVTGESGTGKELVAAGLHSASNRADGRFVTVNCAAIPRDLLESELFGHEKGAFTGAQARRRGKFEQADGGTLFLDEIGELSLEGQAKLLRVLEERRFTRVGGEEEITVDVRVVAATNRDLHAMAQRNTFRLDLLFRLEVIRLELPALRARESDVDLLARHFLDRFRDRLGRPRLELSPAALERLRAHPWFGNVRELRNVMERTAIFAAGPEVQPDDVELVAGRPGAPAQPPSVAAADTVSPIPRPQPRGPAPPAPAAPAAPDGAGPVASIDEVVKRQIEEALEATGGNKKKAAQLLGISRSSLYNYLNRFDMK